jgi:hypothetical protein
MQEAQIALFSSSKSFEKLEFISCSSKRNDSIYLRS